MKTASTSSQLFRCQSRLFPDRVTSVELGGLAEGSCDPTAPVCVGETLVWVSLPLFPFSAGKATFKCAFLTCLFPNAGEIHGNSMVFCVLQRRDIVTGMVEPTDEECEWTSDREEEDALAVSAAWCFPSTLWSDDLKKWLMNQDRRVRELFWKNRNCYGTHLVELTASCWCELVKGGLRLQTPKGQCMIPVCPMCSVASILGGSKGKSFHWGHKERRSQTRGRTKRHPRVLADYIQESGHAEWHAAGTPQIWPGGTN